MAYFSDERASKQTPLPPLRSLQNFAIAIALPLIYDRGFQLLGSVKKPKLLIYSCASTIWLVGEIVSWQSGTFLKRQFKGSLFDTTVLPQPRKAVNVTATPCATPSLLNLVVCISGAGIVWNALAYGRKYNKEEVAVTLTALQGCESGTT